jgi:hypothetical protein
MKKLAIAFLLALVGCQTAAPAPTFVEPPVEFETGFSFEIPCREHGVHINTVAGSTILRVYDITVDGNPVGQATADQIREVLEQLEILKSIQALPVTPQPSVSDD